MLPKKSYRPTTILHRSRIPQPPRVHLHQQMMISVCVTGVYPCTRHPPILLPITRHSTTDRVICNTVSDSFQPRINYDSLKYDSFHRRRRLYVGPTQNPTSSPMTSALMNSSQVWFRCLNSQYILLASTRYSVNVGLISGPASNQNWLNDPCLPG